MRRWLFSLFLVFSMGVFCLPCPVSAVTLTFSEPGLIPGFGPDQIQTGTPKGTLLTNQLASLGVLVSTTPGTEGVAWVTNATFVPGAPTGDSLAINTFPGRTPITTSFAFVDPANPLVSGVVDGSSLSVFVIDSEAIPDPRVIVRTFNHNGILLEEQGLHAFTAPLTFTMGQVARVDFFDNGGDGHLIDNFSFGSITAIAAVPEPSTFLLVAAGALGLLVYGRRRRRP